MNKVLQKHHRVRLARNDSYTLAEVALNVHLNQFKVLLQRQLVASLDKLCQNFVHGVLD
jgi:hypothetical protein